MFHYFILSLKSAKRLKGCKVLKSNYYTLFIRIIDVNERDAVK